MPMSETHFEGMVNNNFMFTVGECILLRMYQISKYRQPSFATVLQRALASLTAAIAKF
jgi:hypothetical protein